MKITSVQFIKSATDPSHYPETPYPEVAFAGRSNVGKSSLINTLVNRKNLARTSNTPGRTRLINFFLVNDAYSLADLPGYGYAKVSEEIRRSWGPMVQTYMERRKNLRLMIVILDIRRDPSEQDQDLLQWFHARAIPFQIVLTKVDKLSRSQIGARKGVLEKLLRRSDSRQPIVFSARTGLGREDVWKAIYQIAFRT